MDDKKYTNENENNNRLDEFEEFNFTDDFPDEFSEDFMKKQPEETPEAGENIFDHDPDFDEEFLPKDSFNPEEQPTFENEEIAPPPQEKRGNILQRHPWITLFAVLVIVFGGYKFWQSLGSTEIIPAPVKTTQKPAQPVIQNATGTTEIRQIDERLDTIEQGMNALNNQLSQLEGAGNRLTQMEQMVSKIAEEEKGLSATLLRLDALDKQVTALTNIDQRLKSLEAQVGVIASEVELHITVAEQTQRAANLSRQAMQAKSMMPIPMVVQAAIPGRAWLLSDAGELISVARGDDVPGYGRVLNIDPVAGTVTMSSETVFREKE